MANYDKPTYGIGAIKLLGDGATADKARYRLQVIFHLRPGTFYHVSEDNLVELEVTKGQESDEIYAQLDAMWNQFSVACPDPNDAPAEPDHLSHLLGARP